MTRPEYAIYRGDELITTGTAYQLAQQFGVQPKTVKFWSTPVYHRRMASVKHPTTKRKYAILITDEE